MGLTSVVVLIALFGVVAINGAAINSLPGFENFSECKTNDCWHELKDALHKLFKTGYEPYGIPKIDPLKIGDIEDEFHGAKYTIHNVELSGFDTIDDAKFVVDKEKKIIFQDGSYDLTFKGHLEQTFDFDKENKYETSIEVHYPNIVVSMKRHFDLEKRLFEGQEETFMVPGEYEMTYKFDGKPQLTLSDDYNQKIKNNEKIQNWLKEHKQELEEANKKDLDKYVKKFTDAGLSVVTKIDEHYPVSKLMPQFHQN